MESLPKKSPYEYEKEVKKSNAMNEQLKSKLTEKEKEVKEKNAEIRKLQQQLMTQSLQDEENAELRSRITVLESEVVERNVEIEQLKDEIKQLQKKVQTLENELHEVKQQHKDDNSGLKNELHEIKQQYKDDVNLLSNQVAELQRNVDSYMLYIGQIAFTFCENAYFYVMGYPLCEEYYPNYSMADIELNVHNIRDVEQRENARLNWEKFQRKVDWKPEKTQLLKHLRKRRNEVAHPGDLDKTKAQEAIEGLDKQRKLRGQMSKGKVQNVVDMWQISHELVY